MSNTEHGRHVFYFQLAVVPQSTCAQVGELAQLVERLDGIEKVGGSTPPFSTSYMLNTLIRAIVYMLCAMHQFKT